MSSSSSSFYVAGRHIYMLDPKKIVEGEEREREREEKRILILCISGLHPHLCVKGKGFNQNAWKNSFDFEQLMEYDKDFQQILHDER